MQLEPTPDKLILTLPLEMSILEGFNLLLCYIYT